jgi:hypothetical protein
MRRCGTIGCCDAGLAGGGVGAAGEVAAGAVGTAGLAGGTTVSGACAGGVTITAGGAAGFSSTGATGAATTETGGLPTGGVTTTATGFSGTTGLGTTTAAFSPTGGEATSGLATGGAAGGVGAGLNATAGCCCCSWRSFSSLKTSPGLEILERSILGLISDLSALSFGADADLAEKCLRTFSASSSSRELEWVFFSVTPTSSKTSRMALLFTSSSLARSLIRIFIRSVIPPSTRFTQSYRPHGCNFCGAWRCNSATMVPARPALRSLAAARFLRRGPRFHPLRLPLRWWILLQPVSAPLLHWLLPQLPLPPELQRSLLRL